MFPTRKFEKEVEYVKNVIKSCQNFEQIINLRKWVNKCIKNWETKYGFNEVNEDDWFEYMIFEKYIKEVNDCFNLTLKRIRKVFLT